MRRMGTYIRAGVKLGWVLGGSWDGLGWKYGMLRDIVFGMGEVGVCCNSRVQAIKEKEGINKYMVSYSVSGSTFMEYCGMATGSSYNVYG